MNKMQYFRDAFKKKIKTKKLKIFYLGLAPPPLFSEKVKNFVFHFFLKLD